MTPESNEGFDVSQSLLNIKDNISKMARGVSSVFSREFTNTPHKNNSDVLSTLSPSHLDLRDNEDILAGVVEEALPYWGWYKVTPYGGTAPLSCALMSDTSQGKIGAKKIGSLRPGDKVHFIRSRSNSRGIIIGVEPELMVNPSDVLATTISAASGHTVISEETNTHLITYTEDACIDSSRGSPVDSTLVGERGWTCETGTTVFIDPFMAFIKADENCGVWCFYFDQLTRVHGHNLQIRSSFAEFDYANDNGEAVGYAGTTPYIWEGMGALDRGTATAKKHEQQEEQIDKPYLAAGDAAASDDKDIQEPYHRLQSYTGYLGQGFRDILRLPPKGGKGINKIGGDSGKMVWEQHLALDGNFHIRSSQGITIAHCPLYSPPVRSVKMENDKDGDSSKDYKFSGAYGSGDDHKLSGTPIEATSFPARALCADDDTAYAFSWRADHPFVYHKKDFKATPPPESEQSPAYGVLSNQWYINIPGEPYEEVDHRYAAKYNKLMSYFKILPDGTIVIAGPNGEEIRMVGGSIELSCPGDIQLRPGRNLISLAGRSTCVRSIKDIDISSSEEDVRIKSEKNLLILAGNGVNLGKLVIENKCRNEGGIVLKSAGEISSLAEDSIYIRSGASGFARNIVLDAGGTSPGHIGLVAKTVASFVSNGRYDFFGQGKDYDPVNMFTKKTTLFGSSVYANGTFACTGHVLCEKWILTSQEHVATKKAKDFGYRVGPLDGVVDKKGTTAAMLLNEQLEKIKAYILEGDKAAAEIFDGEVERPWRAKDRVGDADKTGGWGKYAFYFKKTSEYRADAFVLYETRWQQRARQFNGGGDFWTEKPVVYKGEDTYPYPGKEAWVDKPSLREVDLEFYDSLKPSERIEDRKNLGHEEKSIPDGHYRVIK